MMVLEVFPFPAFVLDVFFCSLSAAFLGGPPIL